MKKDINGYFVILKDLFDKIVVTDKNEDRYKFDEAITKAIRLIIKQATLGGKLLLIGNGASASIASHIAVDFWKNASLKALAFNDSCLLTCISNDFGYRHVFEKPIEMFAEASDVLIAISSSGESENILRGVSAAKAKRIKVITLSGFNENNPLRKLGEINFYVPLRSYGQVEIVHLALCHCLVDVIIKNKFRLVKRLKANERK